jgi:organic radical activating enzyme
MKNEAVAQKAKNTQKQLREKGVIVPYERTEIHKADQSTRLQKNNPMYTPSFLKKSAMNRAHKTRELESFYIKQFIEMPILFTGDNSYPIGNDIEGYYFPDFVIDGKKKAIEIYDTRHQYKLHKKPFFRDKIWEDERKNKLSNFGYDTIFLTEQDKENWKEKVIPFINNGTKIQSVARLDIKQKARIDYPSRKKASDLVTVYNIETESHNYYAEGLLAHNCDIPQSWKFKGVKPDGIYEEKDEVHPMTEKEIVAKILEFDNGSTCKHIVLTGGEPLIQHKNSVNLLKSLHTAGADIEVETNGTIIPNEEFEKYVRWYSVSPKLEGSGNPLKLRDRASAIKYFISTEKAIFKFVICNEQDFEEMLQWREKYEVPRELIYLMPEARTKEELEARTEWLVEMCKNHNFRFCNRLQIYIWGSKRAV